MRTFKQTGFLIQNGAITCIPISKVGLEKPLGLVIVVANTIIEINRGAVTETFFTLLKVFFLKHLC